MRLNTVLASAGAVLAVLAHAPAGEPAPVLLRCQLDKSVARVDELVRITELLDRAADEGADGPQVTAVRYGVCAVGGYDEGKGWAVTNTDRLVPEVSVVDHDRVGLPGAIWSCDNSRVGGRALVVTPRARGREQEFRPYRPGVYLITVSWHLGGDDKAKYGEVVAGSPVVLTVLPKADGDNKK